MRSIMQGCFLLLAAVLLGAGPTRASANTYTVTTYDDGVPAACTPTLCTLRSAVAAANAHPGFDRIVLQPTRYDVRLADSPDGEGGFVDEDENLSGDLDLSDSVWIVGAGRDVSVLRGFGYSRLIEVLPGVTALLSDLTIEYGRSYTSGGGLQNRGRALLMHVALNGNTAASQFEHNYGGGIDNLGWLELLASTVTGNSASSGESGAGQGGGIYNSGNLTIIGSLIADNRSSDDNETGGGSGLYNIGQADIADTVWTGNSLPAQSPLDGSALLNAAPGLMHVSNSTISGNFGGAETGDDRGAAVGNASGASLTLDYVTIAGNAGGGLGNAGEARVIASIIAGNTNNLNVPDPPISYYNGNNCKNTGVLSVTDALFGDDGNCPLAQAIVVDNGEVFATVLAPLYQNGAALPTHALRAGSPAIDAVSAATDCPRLDQRGEPRPRDGDHDGLRACDIGAYERGLLN